MQCWECDLPARATCALCGRFVCKNHATTRPIIIAGFLGSNNTPKLIPVADTIWCGICDPQDPIPMPELF